MWIFLVIGLVAVGIFFKIQARKKMAEFIAGPSKPRPLRNNAVDDLTKASMSLLLVKVSTIDRTGDAVPADASIWRWDGDNLVMKDGVPIGADDIPGAAVDFASASARKHTGAPTTEPLTEAKVTEWLEEGVSKAIAQFVLGGLERSQKRFAIMTRTSPPPSAAELAEMRRENERERAEMDKLMGSDTDSSQLPKATLRKK